MADQVIATEELLSEWIFEKWGEIKNVNYKTPQTINLSLRHFWYDGHVPKLG